MLNLTTAESFGRGLVSAQTLPLEATAKQESFYHAAVTQPLVCDLIVVEVSSPTAKKVPVQSYNSFLDQRSRKVIV